MDYLALLELAISYVETFVVCVGDYQVGFARPFALGDSGYLEPVAHVVALGCDDIHLVIMGIFVEVESAVVVGGDEGVLVLSFVPVNAESLLFCVVEGVYVQFVVVAHCYAFFIVEKREYLVTCAWLGLESVGNVGQLSVLGLGLLRVCLF